MPVPALNPPEFALALNVINVVGSPGGAFRKKSVTAVRVFVPAGNGLLGKLKLRLLKPVRSK
jgi:hypothetical protein